MKKIIVLFISILCFSFYGNAQFKNASIMVEGYSLPYKIMFPENYDETKQYPLLIFLHGAGERGTDNEKQLANGNDFLVNNFQSKYPAIVIAPQCPPTSYWANITRHQVDRNIAFTFGNNEQPTQPMHTLMALVDLWLTSGHVDKSKVYVGGLSMGGMGTYELVWRMPNTFTAAFPICGIVDDNQLNKIASNTALWIFHGAKDDVVLPEFSRNTYKQLKDLESDVKYTEYEEANHNSWDSAFAEPELASWLFSKSK